MSDCVVSETGLGLSIWISDSWHLSVWDFSLVRFLFFRRVSYLLEWSSLVGWRMRRDGRLKVRSVENSIVQSRYGNSDQVDGGFH